MGARKTFFWEQLPPEKLWYLVGLITSDGCLSSDGRHLEITLKEKEYLEDVKFSCRIYPQDNDSEGFFVAKLRRVK